MINCGYSSRDAFSIFYQYCKILAFSKLYGNTAAVDSTKIIMEMQQSGTLASRITASFDLKMSLHLDSCSTIEIENVKRITAARKIATARK